MVIRQCLGRLRRGAVDGAAGRLPVFVCHGVLAERNPDAPRVLLFLPSGTVQKRSVWVNLDNLRVKIPENNLATWGNIVKYHSY